MHTHRGGVAHTAARLSHSFPRNPLPLYCTSDVWIFSAFLIQQNLTISFDLSRSVSLFLSPSSSSSFYSPLLISHLITFFLLCPKPLVNLIFLILLSVPSDQLISTDVCHDRLLFFDWWWGREKSKESDSDFVVRSVLIPRWKQREICSIRLNAQPLPGSESPKQAWKSSKLTKASSNSLMGEKWPHLQEDDGHGETIKCQWSQF